MDKRVEKIVAILDDKKAEGIEVIDMRDKDYFVDYVIIATTQANKHGFALLNYLKEGLKPDGETFLNVEESDEWIVIDLCDILIHLMSGAYRSKYNLEEFLTQREEQKSM